MDISDVRIKLVDPDAQPANGHLLGFASVAFDRAFLVRDLKIIVAGDNRFVAMPSRRLLDRCERCHSKNHLAAHFCNHCGDPLAVDRAPRDETGRARVFVDVAHPITSDARRWIEGAVIGAYERELDLACRPGYVDRYGDRD